MRLRVFSSSIVVTLLSAFVSAQELLPTSTTGKVIEHTYFTLSYSEEHLQAEWVYYVLTPEFVKGNVARTDDFRPDPMISESAQLIDYKGSGYDRGHLCPAADMKHNHTAMSETFYLSNMSPQHPSFNRGIWKKLEAVVRNWSVELGEIYVVTGGVLTSNMGSIGTNKVRVPNYYYKVVYDPSEPKMIGFVLPNEKGTQPLESYVVNVDSVEVLTGINFFHKLKDSIQNVLESHSDVSLWSFTQYRSTTTIKEANETQEAQDTQCQATTQAGTRCKRKAQEGSKYCWQHQGKNQ